MWCPYKMPYVLKTTIFNTSKLGSIKMLQKKVQNGWRLHKHLKYFTYKKYRKNVTITNSYLAC